MTAPWNTMASWAEEMLTSGQELPHEGPGALFSLAVEDRAEIKHGRKSVKPKRIYQKSGKPKGESDAPTE